MKELNVIKNDLIIVETSAYALKLLSEYFLLEENDVVSVYI